MTYVLYNPLADNRNGKANTEKIKEILTADSLKLIDITSIDLVDFFANASAHDRVVIAGGDGTINFLVNKFGGNIPDYPIFYFPIGSGNDFKRDFEDETYNELILLNPYIENLPTVTINGKSTLFLNGVGFGIDGYCCEEGDKLRSKSPEEPINYTSIAIKGLLFHFKPRSAKITVDGKQHEYKAVWIAPTMNGKHYGGGMKVAPDQDRMNPEGKVSVVIMHNPNKFKTLMVFPKIFKGKHIENKNMVEVLTGNEITVTFDKPTPLQIDGETVSGVESYTVISKPHAKKEAAPETAENSEEIHS